VSFKLEMRNRSYNHVKWVPCHHGIARPRVADRGDGLLARGMSGACIEQAQ
jgi:hypothetical protein